MNTDRTADILKEIVAARRARISESGGSAAAGREQGIDLPAVRPDTIPVVPFPGPVICEIKRRSPSRGVLAADIDPVQRAGGYRAAGADSVSVLTEEEYFSGSLADLVAVKQAFPDLAVLRKDFLLDEEDVVVSWRAGADAVLLIAAILEVETLGRMARTARDLGMKALVEVHTTEELARVAPLTPELIGINSRDLRTFRVDLLNPLAVAAGIDWECRLVFESGVFFREDVRLARDGGFFSILVGEAVVREPRRVRMLVDEMAAGETATSPGRSRSSFWMNIANRRRRRSGQARGGATVNGGGTVIGDGYDSVAASSGGPARPLVKVCGVCSVEDALLAQACGADLIGMIYAVSPRTAPAGLARAIREAGVTLPLVAVVLEGFPGENASLLARAQEELEAGVISALQLHGTSQPDEALQYGWPVYTAVRFSASDEVASVVAGMRTPRFLVDAFDPKAAGGTGRDGSGRGGTGRTVEAEVLHAVEGALRERPHGELWLAGGLNPDTVAAALTRWRPELIDASSGLESEPGRKDPEKMRRFFEVIGMVTT